MNETLSKQREEIDILKMSTKVREGRGQALYNRIFHIRYFVAVHFRRKGLRDLKNLEIYILSFYLKVKLIKLLWLSSKLREDLLRPCVLCFLAFLLLFGKFRVS